MNASFFLRPGLPARLNNSAFINDYLMRFITLLVCLFTLFTHFAAAATPATASTADIRLASNCSLDSLRVSLLTVAPGPLVYERFGHTAIRVQGLPNSRDGYPVVVGYTNGTALVLPHYNLTSCNTDLVFHYGIFNFNAPNFVYRFVKGETDYSIGCIPYAYMEQDYDLRGSRMTEQELNLTPEQARDLLLRLLVNYLPYNRKYRYSFFFDNCATRPFNIIDAATDSTIIYDRALHPQTTLRDMLREKTGRNTWLDFGISLVIAGRADQPTTFEEQMFLPDYLQEAYRHASIPAADSAVALPLVSREQVVLTGNPQLQQAMNERPNPLTTPVACGWILFAVTALLTALEVRTRRRMLVWDALLLVASGLGGIIVWFLNFCSLHPAVDHNWNCLWLVPANLLFAVLIWIKCCKKVVVFYFFITFVALIAYLLVCGFADQFVHPAFIPMVLALALRAGMWCKGLLTKGCKRLSYKTK